MGNEAHVRIDKGVKRGPRGPYKPRKPKVDAQLTTDSLGQPTTTQNKPAGKLAEANPKQVLERYLQGETTTQIAASYGVTRQGLGYFLRSTAPEPWQQAQIILAVERKEKAEDALETAPDALSLARAREQLRGAQWELERVFSRIYGLKQEVTLTHAVPLEVAKEIELLREELRLVAPKQHDATHKPAIIDVVPEQQIIEK